ncbi:hypothetical protein BJA01nite_48390 [Bradyrhizobium japonicum]|jgi:hypothetical protein|uniref:Uncharacterized protein n=1 Tax=Bradyrhizobium arachidis TaxID=858423 RepID=A0AAE7NSM6_9BRAD|nr:hypothetical protein RN69_14825 [Bradyrhizobium japonicum]KMJ95196.1 hypothetical protein CF64_33640 [Bradyrhizobium japonicum]QOZ71218.1 hypothetical protein WN72_36725 [Bradyrhizobium arachidis]BAL08312.1 hypothetical protein BJ6T_30370 [Bradyrhizobium japonicum USDA 6]GEC47197.1 hypothetical protein BJA01nite_48390 [Bradyrhizobium japonicum]
MEAHLLQVTTDDGECRFWLAAGTEEEAVQLVLDAIPEGWTAKLIDRGGTAGEQASALGLTVGLAPGEAREVSRGIGLS